MKLLLVSDLHYALPQFDWLLALAKDPRRDVDAIVIAGDLLDIRSAVPIDAQAVAVTAHLKAIGQHLPVLCASGNHDLDGRDAVGEKASRWLVDARAEGVYVDGDTVLIDGVLFTVCPWWDGPLGRAELDERLASDSLLSREKWALIYHAPPTDSPLAWDGRRSFGDEALSTWIEKLSPDIVLAGHIHQAPFVDAGGWSQQIRSTWIFNPGQQPGPVPAYIILDTATGEATWASATDRRDVILA